MLLQDSKSTANLRGWEHPLIAVPNLADDIHGSMALGIYFVVLLILLCENGSQQSDAFNIVTCNHAKARSASSSAKTLSSMAISYIWSLHQLKALTTRRMYMQNLSFNIAAELQVLRC